MNCVVLAGIVFIVIGIVAPLTQTAPDGTGVATNYSESKAMSDGVTPYKAIFMGQAATACWQCSPPCGNGYCCNDGYPQCCIVGGYCRCCRS